MRDHREEYQKLSPEAKARKNARNQLPEVKQQKKEYYQRDKHLLKERYHQNFAIVVKFLEERDECEGCIKCGSKERLELDHINQQDKKWNPKRSMCSKVLFVSQMIGTGECITRRAFFLNVISINGTFKCFCYILLE